MTLPKAKHTDILVQSVGDELLVYELKTNKAYNLNETSALIYQHCDGTTTSADLKRKHHHLTDDIIYFALDELKRENLIESNFESIFTGVSRRDVIKRVGLASMMALPIITSIIAPKAAHAQSGCSCPSTEPADCVSDGRYSIGCFANVDDCEAAAITSAGDFGAPNHCCFGIVGAIYSDNCCTVLCRNPPG